MVGIPIIRDGYLNLAGEIQDREPTNRTGADPRRQYNLIAWCLDLREVNLQSVQPSLRRSRCALTVKLFLNSAALPIAGCSGAPVVSGSPPMPIARAKRAGFYRLANDARNFPAIYSDGFLPLITTDTDDYSTVVGICGELLRVEVDLSGQAGLNKVDFRP